MGRPGSPLGGTAGWWSTRLGLRVAQARPVDRRTVADLQQQRSGLLGDRPGMPRTSEALCTLGWCCPPRIEMAMRNVAGGRKSAVAAQPALAAKTRADYSPGLLFARLELDA